MIRRVLLLLLSTFAVACDSPGPVSVDPPCPPECPPPPPPQQVGEWSEAEPLLSARREMPAVAMGGRIWIGGGFGEDRIVLSSYLSYDPQAGMWTAVTPLPAPRHHHGTAALDGRAST
jgi:hypothetical protein